VLRATLTHPVAPVVLAPVVEKRPQRTPATEAQRVAKDDPKVAASENERMASVGANVLPLSGVEFYPTNVLTVRPQPLNEVELDTDETATVAAFGKMRLSLWINEQGEVVDLLVEHNDMPELFLRVAEKAFRNLKFSPGELNGTKVGALMRVEVGYEDLRGTAP
jgi:hypothetical protein